MQSRSWTSAIVLPSVTTLFFSLGAGCTSGNPNFDSLEDGETWQGGTYSAAICSSSRSGPATLHCSGGAAAFALGVCGDLDSPNTLDVRAHHGEPANLAVEGATKISSPLRVDGSFYAQGTVAAPNTMEIRGNLIAGDDWIVSSPARVDGNASIVGTLDARNQVRVDGALIAGEILGENNIDTESLATGAVSFTTPMICNAAPRATQVAATIRNTVDHDAAVGLPGNALVDLRVPTVLTLGCGTYRLDSITANNTLTIRIVGPTVILVDGDVRIASPTNIQIADGGSLELVIAGSLQIDNTLTIADEEHPAWVAVGGTLRVGSPMKLWGSLLAPDSDVAADNTLEVRGGALLGSLRVGSPVSIDNDFGLTAQGCVASKP